MNKKEKVDKDDILEPLKGAQDYLDKLSLKKDLIIVPLNNEKYNDAFREFNNMIEGIETLNNILFSIKSLVKLDLDKIYYEDESLIIKIRKFNNFLSNDLIESMKNEDYQLISDLLEYEFDSYISEYKEVFRSLEDYIEENY